jgi:sugar phosphate isomerase/epimerase
MRCKAPSLSLWPACVRRYGVLKQIDAAKAGGFSELPIDLLNFSRMVESGVQPEHAIEIAAKKGVRFGHLDGFSGWLPIRYSATAPQELKTFLDFSVDEALEVCRKMRLTKILAICASDIGMLPTEAIIENFITFCKRATDTGIWIDLEFIPMWGIPDLRSVCNIVERSKCSCGIMFDTWHFIKGSERPDVELLKEIPAEQIVSVQIGDGWMERRGADLSDDCTHHRALPGRGDLPIKEVLEILRQKAVSNIGPEIFSDDLDQLSAEEAGRECGESTRESLAAAEFRVANT